MNDYIISVENLTKRFGELVAVDDINFQVAPGEIFGFLGPNGAGKTTTINILCTLTKPSSGKATVNDYDVVHQQSQVRQSIGLVFQDPSLDERLSGLQNLRFHALVYNVPASIREQKIEQVLRMVELWDRASSQVRTYSGGMKRRLEIARGLLHHPDVLFLDEPTLGLDPQTRNRIWEYTLEMRQREGTTIFLTTHDMLEADKLSDRVAFMNQGKIVALDTPHNLKQQYGKRTLKAEVETDLGNLENRQIILDTPDTPNFIGELFAKEKVVTIHSEEASLEDIFIEITGRGLIE